MSLLGQRDSINSHLSSKINVKQFSHHYHNGQNNYYGKTILFLAVSGVKKNARNAGFWLR